MTTVRSLCCATTLVAVALFVPSCGEGCDDYIERPPAQTYTVTDAYEPVLVGATVTMTEDTMTIEYDRDGTAVTVTYAIGEHF